jgi:hypothetical protein
VKLLIATVTITSFTLKRYVNEYCDDRCAIKAFWSYKLYLLKLAQYGNPSSRNFCSILRLLSKSLCFVHISHKTQAERWPKWQRFLSIRSVLRLHLYLSEAFLWFSTDFQGKCWDSNSNVYVYALSNVRSINLIYFLLINSQLSYRLHWTSYDYFEIVPTLLNKQIINK